MDKKYLVIEHHKFKTFKDDWTIKYANVDEDTAFTKMVALRTLNDNKDIFHYLVDMSYLWKKDEPFVLTKDMEVKQNSESEDMPF